MFGDIDLTLEVQNVELFLAKPDRKIISKLTEAYGKNLTLKLGGISELSFTIPYEVDINRKWVRNSNVDIIRDRYLIKAIFAGKEEWYIISTITNSMADGDTMQVVAYLMPYEMTGKNVRSFQYDAINIDQVFNGGTIINGDGTTEVINGILGNTRWKLGYVDASISGQYRGFDFTSVTVLDAIFTIAETFNALIIWDTATRTINFYNSENYGINRGLTINYGHYLQGLSKESHSDEMVTRLKVFGKDNLSIQGVNANGQNYLEDYSFFMYPFQRDATTHSVIEHSYYMSDELCHAILDYSEYMQSKSGQFKILIGQRQVYENTFDLRSIEMATLKEQMLVIQNNLDLANSLGSNSAPYVTLKNAKQVEIDAKQVLINSAKASMDAIDTQKATLSFSLQYSRFFTSTLLLELNDYVIEKEFSNENFIDEDDLYDGAIVEFEKVKQPQVVLTMDVVNFLKIVDAQKDWSKLNLGDIIIIRYEKLGVDMTAKIIEISIDFEGDSISLTIANTKDILTDEQKLIKMLYANNAAATTMDLSKTKWDGIEGTKSQVEQIINNTWDTIKTGIQGGLNNSVSFDERGILVRDSANPSTYLVIQNGVLAITNDGGNTWKHAITSTGIVGERIYGKLLAGVNLTIDASDAGGTKMFTVDGSGVKILGTSLTITGGISEANLDPAFITRINNDIADVQDSVEQLGVDINNILSDNKITAIEANGLELSLVQVASESTDLISVANTLGITTERTNYSNSLTTLTTEINKWINQTTYPKDITSTDRTNIQTKFQNLEGMKSILINKISSIREQRAKDASVGLGANYNGMVIDSVNGIVITKGDGTIRTTLNATDGFFFEKKNGALYEKKLYYNAATGNMILDGELNARSIKINGQEVIAGNFLSGTMIDKIKANQIDVTTAKITTAQIENLIVGTNVTMGATATISWASQVTGKPFIPTTASDVGALSTGSPMLTFISGTGIYTGSLTANQITAGKITSAFIDTDNLSANRIFRSASNGSGYLSLAAANSSGQSLADLELWYGAGTSSLRWFRIVNLLAGARFEAFDTKFLESDGASTDAYGIWNFSGATVTGLNAVFA